MSETSTIVVLVALDAGSASRRVVLVATPPTPRAGHRCTDLRGSSPCAVRLGGGVARGWSSAVSGWLLPGAVVGGGAPGRPIGSWQGAIAVATTVVERTDALASWIENVRDVLIAGEQPIGAIDATVATCPP